MVFTADPSNLGGPVGAEVVSLNGTLPREMLRTLMTYARADGHNDAKRASLLGVSGGDTIEFFDVFHGLLFGAPAGGAHQVTLRGAGGGEVRMEVAAIGLADRRGQMQRRDRANGEAVWDWRVRPDGVAVLTMPSWALYDSKWDWKTWLDDRLDSLQNGGALLVDLRQNEGGEDCGDATMQDFARSSDPALEKAARWLRA